MTVQVDDRSFPNSSFAVVDDHSDLEGPSPLRFVKDEFVTRKITQTQSSSFLNARPEDSASASEDSVPVATSGCLLICEGEQVALEAEYGNQVAEIHCPVDRVYSLGPRKNRRCGKVDLNAGSDSRPSIFNVLLVQEDTCDVYLLQPVTLRELPLRPSARFRYPINKSVSSPDSLGIRYLSIWQENWNCHNDRRLRSRGEHKKPSVLA